MGFGMPMGMAMQAAAPAGALPLRRRGARPAAGQGCVHRSASWLCRGAFGQAWARRPDPHLPPTRPAPPLRTLQRQRRRPLSLPRRRRPSLTSSWRASTPRPRSRSAGALCSSGRSCTLLLGSAAGPQHERTRRPPSCAQRSFHLQCELHGLRPALPHGWLCSMGGVTVPSLPFCAGHQGDPRHHRPGAEGGQGAGEPGICNTCVASFVTAVSCLGCPRVPCPPLSMARAAARGCERSG